MSEREGLDPVGLEVFLGAVEVGSDGAFTSEDLARSELWPALLGNETFQQWMEALGRYTLDGELGEQWARLALGFEVDRMVNLMEKHEAGNLVVPFLTILAEQSLPWFEIEHIERRKVQRFEVTEEEVRQFAEEMPQVALDYADTESASAQAKAALQFLGKRDSGQVVYGTNHGESEGACESYVYVLTKENGAKTWQGEAFLLPDLNDTERAKLVARLGGRLVTVKDGNQGVEFLQVQVDEGRVTGERIMQLASEVTHGRVDELLWEYFPTRLEKRVTADLPETIWLMDDFLTILFWAAERARVEAAPLLPTSGTEGGGFDSPRVRDEVKVVVEKTEEKNPGTHRGMGESGKGGGQGGAEFLATAAEVVFEPRLSRPGFGVSRRSVSDRGAFLLPQVKMVQRLMPRVSGNVKENIPTMVPQLAEKEGKIGEGGFFQGIPFSVDEKAQIVLPADSGGEVLPTTREEIAPLVSEEGLDGWLVSALSEVTTQVGGEFLSSHEVVVGERGAEKSESAATRFKQVIEREKFLHRELVRPARAENEQEPSQWRQELVIVEQRGVVGQVVVPVWTEAGGKQVQEWHEGLPMLAASSLEGQRPGHLRRYVVEGAKMFQVEEKKEFDEPIVVSKSGICVPQHILSSLGLANRVADWLVGWRGIFQTLSHKKSTNMATPRFTRPPFFAPPKMHYGFVCFMALNIFIEQLNEHIDRYQKKVGRSKQKVKEGTISIMTIDSWEEFLRTRQFGEATIKYGYASQALSRRFSQARNGDFGRLLLGPRILNGDAVRPETLLGMTFQKPKERFSFAQPLFLQLPSTYYYKSLTRS